jgi:hypothetical protein
MGQIGIGWNNGTINMDDEWWNKAKAVSTCFMNITYFLN